MTIKGHINSRTYKYTFDDFYSVYMPSSYTLLALELISQIREPTKTYNFHQFEES
ncbi:transcriptional regulator [Thermoanaerobacterium thermosaccharolyticum]|uniref:Transcriptional regulator n=1 Tax=Thermoanaerobacterium thermosaccharolyticum TaxID=1517 RepID=A0A223HZR3_THETR|nr:transcriptional regulator [Thermoanaerobacterium thermosaccharolyticum]